MNEKTRTLLTKVSTPEHICPNKLGEAMPAFMEAVASSKAEASALRQDYALMIGRETDQGVRGRMNEIDSKLAAFETEAQKLMTQLIKLQDLAQRIRDAGVRIHDEIETNEARVAAELAKAAGEVEAER